jgi:hypothetical protein
VSSRKIWTGEQVRALGVATDVATAGSILGLSRTQAYMAIRRGTFPVPTFTIGRKIRVPVAPILRLLGLDELQATDGDEAGSDKSRVIPLRADAERASS